MKKISPSIYLFAFAIVIILAIVGFAMAKKSLPGDYDEFAQCLSDKSLVMYGAYWCPHCKNQKEEFGSSFQYVDYVECATPGNPNVMTQECRDAGVEGYPTWITSDGDFLRGEQSLENLARATGCTLPSDQSAE